MDASCWTITGAQLFSKSCDEDGTLVTASKRNHNTRTPWQKLQHAPFFHCHCMRFMHRARKSEPHIGAKSYTLPAPSSEDTLLGVGRRRKSLPWCFGWQSLLTFTQAARKSKLFWSLLAQRVARPKRKSDSHESIRATCSHTHTPLFSLVQGLFAQIGPESNKACDTSRFVRACLRFAQIVQMILFGHLQELLPRSSRPVARCNQSTCDTTRYCLQETDIAYASKECLKAIQRNSLRRPNMTSQKIAMTKKNSTLQLFWNWIADDYSTRIDSVEIL